MKRGDIVVSTAGKDKNSFLAVIGFDEGYVLVVDGKHRPLERPKRKNEKHIFLTGQSLKIEEFISNNSLRRALKHCKIKEDF